MSISPSLDLIDFYTLDDPLATRPLRLSPSVDWLNTPPWPRAPSARFGSRGSWRRGELRIKCSNLVDGAGRLGTVPEGVGPGGAISEPWMFTGVSHQPRLAARPYSLRDGSQSTDAIFQTFHQSILKTPISLRMLTAGCPDGQPAVFDSARSQQSKIPPSTQRQSQCKNVDNSLVNILTKPIHSAILPTNK